MRVDPKTKEVTLTEIEYHELTNLPNPKSEVDFEDKFAKFLERKDAELGARTWSEEDLRELALYFYQSKNDDNQPKVDYNKFEKLFYDFCERNKGLHITSHDACMWFWKLGLNARKEQPEGGCSEEPNNLLSKM